MIGIYMEPARFGTTGEALGVYGALRQDVEWDAVQPLDAPEQIARGSLRAGCTSIDGAQWVSTTDVMPVRCYGALS